MALPRGLATEGSNHLLRMAIAVTPEEFKRWPKLTNDDFSLVGKLIVTCSHADVAMARIFESLNELHQLPPLTEKPENMSTGAMISKIKMVGRWTADETRMFSEIEDLRTVRNLLAHFMIRRFPSDDAFVFITKSARDYNRIIGALPQYGEALLTVASCSYFHNSVENGLGLLARLGGIALMLEDEVKATSKPDVAV